MDANSFVENPFIHYALPEWMQAQPRGTRGGRPREGCSRHPG